MWRREQKIEYLIPAKKALNVRWEEVDGQEKCFPPKAPARRKTKSPRLSVAELKTPKCCRHPAQASVPGT